MVSYVSGDSRRKVEKIVSLFGQVWSSIVSVLLVNLLEGAP